MAVSNAQRKSGASSAGANLSPPSSKMWISPPALARARAAGFRALVAAGDAANEIFGMRFGKKDAVVMGNEGHGRRARGSAAATVRCASRIRRVESLNVGVACGIFWDKSNCDAVCIPPGAMAKAARTLDRT